MIRTYCDVCKQEMRENYAAKKIRFAYFDYVGINGMADIHLCKQCAYNIIRDGKETS